MAASSPTDAKIRNAIWYLKQGKTKKFICEYLGIKYDVASLDRHIKAFKEREEREAKLRAAAKKKVFTAVETSSIVKSYLQGASITTIAAEYFVTYQRIKKILIEANTPLRARGKNKQASVEHVVQNLEISLKPNDKVFIPSQNCYALVDKVFDEEYLDYLHSGKSRYVELRKVNYSKVDEPIKDVHYTVYWDLPDGVEMKLDAVQNQIAQINKVLEQTGREYYRVWIEGDYGCFKYFHRDQLIPVKVN